MNIEDWDEFTFSNDKRFVVKDSPFSEKLTEKELQDKFNFCELRSTYIEVNIPDQKTDEGKKDILDALKRMSANYEKKYKVEKERLLADHERKHRSALHWFEYEIKAKECEEFLLKHLGKGTLEKELREKYIETPPDPRTYSLEDTNES